MRIAIFGLTVSSSWGNGHATLWRGLCSALAEAGLARSTRCEVNEVWTLLELVEQGLGVAIIPEMFGAAPMDARYVPLDPPMPDFELVAAFLGSAPESATARAFLALLTQEMLGREVTSSPRPS